MSACKDDLCFSTNPDAEFPIDIAGTSDMFEILNGKVFIRKCSRDISAMIVASACFPITALDAWYFWVDLQYLTRIAPSRS